MKITEFIEARLEADEPTAKVAAMRAIAWHPDTYPDTRKYLAAIWSDHPDYQSEWAIGFRYGPEGFQADESKLGK